MEDTESASDVASECSTSSEDSDLLSEQSKSPTDSSSDSETDEDNGEWEVVQLSEDEEDVEKRISERDSKEMVCLRCPTSRKGTFKDKRKYFFHIKRHMFGNHFSCPTCHRPFIKMSYCISHEIRVHGANIQFEHKHPVVVYAKDYVNAKAQTDSKTDDTDCEDVSFYENHVICSNALMRYQGPPVHHMVECYEIQFFHSRNKPTRANIVARKAIERHKKNVAYGFDVHRLGRFQKKRVQPQFNPSSPPESVSVSGHKRPRSPAPDGESTVPEPPKKKRRIRFISLSSSEDDTESDKDFNPPTKKISLKDYKKQRKKPPSKALPALLETVCRHPQCNYVWKNDTDLRTHRDAMHPNVPIFELMAINAPLPKLPRKKKPKPKPEVAEKDDDNMFSCLGKFSKKDLGLSKKKKEGPLTSPEPDSTFTDKERYLHDIGLSNTVRLQLFKNKSSQPKLPECHVPLRRLTDVEILFHTSRLDSSFPFRHFLLGSDEISD